MLWSLFLCVYDPYSHIGFEAMWSGHRQSCEIDKKTQNKKHIFFNPQFLILNLKKNQENKWHTNDFSHTELPEN